MDVALSGRFTNMRMLFVNGPLARYTCERVRLAFGYCRVGDADELRFLFKFGNGLGADIAHAHLYARRERGDDFPHGPFVRHERFDAFGHRLASVGKVPLFA